MRRLTRKSFKTSPPRAGVIAFNPTPPRYAPSTPPQRTGRSGYAAWRMFRQARVRTTSRSAWKVQATPSARKSTPARCSKKTRASWKKACTRPFHSNKECAAGRRPGTARAGKARPGVAEQRRSEASSAAPGPPGRNGVRLAFELVRKRVELRGLLVGRVRERLGDEPVREPRVPRQQRAVEVRSDGAPESAALVAAFTVVAET